MSGSPVRLCDGGLLQSPRGSTHCFLVGLTFYYSIYMMGKSGEHMVLKGSSVDGD
jgi:hypothetical protein